jgi:sterol desaturase/sphingolipid hydroxylase (fatty acid hydroxylase superfamily)
MAKHFVSNKDETVRIFQGAFMEMMSRTHWSVPLIFFVPTILYFSYLGFSQTSNIVLSLLFSLFGLFIWTIMEYTLHRHVFHFHPKSKIGKKVHWIIHGVHHDYPQDSLRLVMPPSLSFPLATFFYFLFASLIHKPFLFNFFSFFLIGYILYDMSHYAMHHYAFKNKFMLELKKHHMKHHYVNPDAGYGVSSDLWDRVFKTNYPEKIKE